MNKTKFDIDRLREEVKRRMDDERFAHTLGVEDMAARLGEVYLPHRVDELRCAALLHDVTKCDCAEKQLQYIEEFGIIIDDLDEIPRSILHSVTGAEVARREFPAYATDEVVSAVRWHTTGHRMMTLFECIVYLADYIEEGRDYDDCVKVRRYLWDNLAVTATYEEKLRLLYKTVVYQTDLTLSHLISKNVRIDVNTIEVRNYYLGLLSGKEQTL